MLAELENISNAWLSLIKSAFKLFKLEAKLARLALKPIIIISFLVLLTIISLWIASFLFIGFYLYSILQSVFITMGIIIAIHFILLFIFAIMIYNYYQQMQFKQTRALFQNKRLSHAKTTSKATD